MNIQNKNSRWILGTWYCRITDMVFLCSIERNDVYGFVSGILFAYNPDNQYGIAFW